MSCNRIMSVPIKSAILTAMSKYVSTAGLHYENVEAYVSLERKLATLCV